jgi:hypothetical protein
MSVWKVQNKINVTKENKNKKITKRTLFHALPLPCTVLLTRLRNTVRKIWQTQQISLIFARLFLMFSGGKPKPKKFDAGLLIKAIWWWIMNLTSPDTYFLSFVIKKRREKWTRNQISVKISNVNKQGRGHSSACFCRSVLQIQIRCLFDPWIQDPDG